MPLTFFYPEYEGKKRSPQAYVKEAVKRQQELNELCRRNMAEAQMRQRKKYDEKKIQAKPYTVGKMSGCSRISYLEGNEKTTKEMARTVYDNGGTPAGKVLPLEYRACSAL